MSGQKFSCCVLLCHVFSFFHSYLYLPHVIVNFFHWNRCIIALHNLISNKLFNRDAEKNEGKEKEEKKKKALEESKKKKEEEKAGGDAKDAKETEKSSK